MRASVQHIDSAMGRLQPTTIVSHCHDAAGPLLWWLGAGIGIAPRSNGETTPNC